MFTTSIQTISELISLLKQLQENEVYDKPVVSLSGATIGQHTRHIIELFQCLLDGYESGTVNYDRRKRDRLLETNSYRAIKTLELIKEKLGQKINRDLKLEVELNGELIKLPSNYYREVYYNLEHCIHHEALIKVALIEMKISEVTENFGVAPSTIQYRNQCAQ
jgi:hypothetical protein